MVDRAFIVEDSKSEADVLKEHLGLLGIDRSKIETIKRLDEAYQKIKASYSDSENIAVFIDIWWGSLSDEKGITMAKTLRSTWPKIKLVAYTKIGTLNDDFFQRLKPFFDAIIDKVATRPHPSAMTILALQRDWLEKLSSGNNMWHANPNDKSISYIFQQVSARYTFAQFLVSDFVDFSLYEEDLQLQRFKALQVSLAEALQREPIEETMVVLPTGDGLAIGIVAEISVNPIALKLAFGILERLREQGLDAQLRMGIHYGRVCLLEGSKGELQLIGTGINKATRVQTASAAGKALVSEEYHSAFIDRSSNPFCLTLTVSEPQEYTVKKEPAFRARFVSRGKVGA